MLIINENNIAINIDNIYNAFPYEYFYILDLNILDYTLTPFLMLEEINSPALELKINNFRFKLPSFWNIIVVDSENMVMDVVQVSDLAGKEFNAFGYGFNEHMPFLPVITIDNYIPEYITVAPSLLKNQVLCHPITPSTWVHITPNDVYLSYLKDITCGDII